MSEAPEAPPSTESPTQLAVPEPEPRAEPQFDAEIDDLDALMGDIAPDLPVMAGEESVIPELPVVGEPPDMGQPGMGQANMGQANMDSAENLQFTVPPLTNQFQSKEDIERERMKLLVSHFDEQQMSRYAAFRRANIRRAAVKKYANHLLNQPISNNVAVVLAGMSKVLIGDIIELARDLQEKEQAAERRKRGIPDPPPGAEPERLLPSFIREAWRIYKEETGTVPGSKIRPGSAGRFF